MALDPSMNPEPLTFLEWGDTLPESHSTEGVLREFFYQVMRATTVTEINLAAAEARVRLDG